MFASWGALARAYLCLLVAIALSGCLRVQTVAPKPTPDASPPANALSNIQDAIEPIISDNQALLDHYRNQTGNYYIQLKVRAAVRSNPVDPCLDPSLWTLARQLFFKKESKSGLIYVSVTSNDPILAAAQPMQSPVVGIIYDEKAPAPSDRCYTNATNGYISPLVRADPAARFDITIRKKYSTSVEVTALDTVFQLANTAALAFGGSGLALEGLNAAALQARAQAVDTRISALMSGTASDIRSVSLPSTNGKDAFAVRILDVQLGGLTGASFSFATGGFAIVELVPVKSVFLDRPRDNDTIVSYKPTYNTNPIQILQKEAAAGRQILDVVNRDPFITAYQNLESSPDAKKMGRVCADLAQMLSNDLRLTSDDELIARWAILKFKTDYDDASFAMRSEKCWSTDDAKRAADLDKAFVFSDQRPDPSKTIKPQLDALNIPLMNALGSLSDGHYKALSALIDPNTFQIVSWGSALPPPQGQKWNSFTGPAALAILSKQGPIGAGCWQAAKAPGDLVKSGIMLRLGSSRIPVAVVRDDKQKITRLIFGDADAISSYVNTPEGWPQSCDE